MISTEKISKKIIWKLLEQIPDPEIPVLSVTDLGIIRDIKLSDEEIEIIITPTYSGCPAMDMIRMNIRLIMTEHGYQNIKITTLLSPAWTTDWMSEHAKKELLKYGIAPPLVKNSFEEIVEVKCPLCNSGNTKLISQFGSTLCKALYQCNDCKEPFDYFKCH